MSRQGGIRFARTEATEELCTSIKPIRVIPEIRGSAPRSFASFRLCAFAFIPFPSQSAIERFVPLFPLLPPFPLTPLQKPQQNRQLSTFSTFPRKTLLAPIQIPTDQKSAENRF